MLRHNVTVMHVEKNDCDMLLGTLLNIKGKTNDSLYAKRELTRLKIRKELRSIHKGKE